MAIYKTSLRSIVGLLLIDQHIAVAGLTGVHVDNGLVSVLHGALLDPGLHILLGGQLQHLTDLAGAADQGATELDALHNESAGRDGERTVIRNTELDEVAVGLEERDVVDKGHLSFR